MPEPILFSVPMLAIPLGYAVARWAEPRRQLTLFCLVLALPFLVLTAVMFSMPAGEFGRFGGWVFGLIMLALPLMMWVILAFAGYGLARIAKRQ